MVPTVSHDPFNPAFNVRVQVGQYRCGAPAHRKGFTIDHPLVRMRRKEKPTRNFCLPVPHDVERGNPALPDT
jgi:hypothetical protein